MALDRAASGRRGEALMGRLLEAVADVGPEVVALPEADLALADSAAEADALLCWISRPQDVTR